MKTINIKGKEYVPVNERLKEFRSNPSFAGYAIDTQLVEFTPEYCVFVTKIADESGRIVSSGYAAEERNASNINKTSYVENCECVPLGAQILTFDGWKFYYEVREGDLVLTYNIEKKQNEWSPLERVSVYKDQPLLEVKTSRFMSVFTKGHKWFSDGAMKRYEEIASYKKLTTMPSQPKVDGSAIGKKLGWLLTDCVVDYSKDGLPTCATITQAKYTKEVAELFGKGFPVKQSKSEWKECFRWFVPAKELRTIFAHFGIRTYKDVPNVIQNWSLEDIQGFFDAAMLADGTKNGNVFGKTDLELVEAIQTACTLLGIKTGKISTHKPNDQTTRPLYLLPIHKTDGAFKSEFKEKILPPNDVWCPTTQNGNWYCRYRGYQYLTGNTSSIGRALGIFGIGIDTAVCSADELKNAIDAQEAAKAPIPDSYLATINSLLAEVGDVKDKTIDEVAARVCEVWHVESIRDLSAGQGIEVMRTLRKWAGK